MKVTWEAWIGKMDTNLESLETKTKEQPERMEADQEELEANQEKTEAVAEHYEKAPRAEATCVLTRQQERDSHLLHEVLKGIMYEGRSVHFGPIWGPVPGHWLEQSSQNMEPQQWQVPARICHHHRTISPLCVSCTIQKHKEENRKGNHQRGWEPRHKNTAVSGKQVND
jgi:hypothetical protein